jgi:hypothetical protein
VLDRDCVETTAGCLLKDRQDIQVFKASIAGLLLEKLGDVENSR